MDLTIADCLAAAKDTLEFTAGKDAAASVPGILERHFGGAPAYIVADEHTWEAAGARVESALREAGASIAGCFIFPGEPRLHADYAHAAALAALLREAAGAAGAGPAPISVGSGTVNDLVKRAAHEAGLSYLCVPTAASVDGYTSAGAALLDGGFKRTFPCPAPRAVAADEAILAAAPAYLASSGFGDLAGKIVAGTDWIIAARAAAAGVPGTEPIDPLAWDMTQTKLSAYLEKSADAVRGDGEAVAALFEALALTGFAMQYTSSSRPVSGCEHLYSHLWEMADLCVAGVPVTHGHKVALGTLCAAGLTRALFRRKEPPAPTRLPMRAPSAEERAAQVRRAFAEGVAGKAVAPSAVEAAVATALEKLPSQAALGRIREWAADSWTELRAEVLDRLPSYAELRAALARAGCPVRPEEAGLGRTEALGSARRAQMLRVRYTALDLAWDLGVLDELLGELEAEEDYLR